MTADEKRALYAQAKEKIKMYVCVKGDVWARLATIEAVLHQTIPYYFWTGVYVLIDGDLIVRSYQGPVACQLLKQHARVCWASIDSEKTIVVPDVEQFPGHIACSSLSKSEIVVPLRDEQGKVFGCFDIDSKEEGSFDDVDAECLEDILKLMYEIVVF